jgi:molybdenum cofactor cytidylyltransferase
MTPTEGLAAIVLAAGLSRRMGRPKLVLPWGKTSVIAQVTGVLLAAGLDPVVVVTGGAHTQIKAALQDQPTRLVYNPRYAEDQMALSLQAGLAEIQSNWPDSIQAALIALGDQPQIEAPVVQAVIAEFQASGAALVAPSYQMHRGHPWVVHRSLWAKIMALTPPQTLRDFLADNIRSIHYLVVDRPSILQDLDTPEDYEHQAPR